MTTYEIDLTEEDVIEDVEEVGLELDADEVAEIPVAVPTDWDHSMLLNRDAENSHPMTAITGLSALKVRTDTMETGARVNVIEKISANGALLPISDKAVNIEIPTRFGMALKLDEQGRVFLLDTSGDVLSYIDTGVDRLIKSGYYDEETQTIILVADDDTKIEIPASGLVDIYTADEDSLTMLDRAFALSPTSKETLTNSIRHIADKGNPHGVTKAQIGLGNVDNTADLAKPISTAMQTALDAKADTSALKTHSDRTDNPHKVTKSQVGLGNVDNTADLMKPISTATQTALDAKQDTISGGASSIVDADLTPSHALISDAQGKVAISDVSSTELARLLGVRSKVQDQIDGKQDTISGGASSIVDADLTPSHALISDAQGKVAVSGTTSDEILTLQGIKSNIQTQIDGKVSASAGKGLSTNDYTDTDKAKLAGIETGARVNVIERVSVNGTPLVPSSKAVDISVPTKVGQLTNDAGYITKAVDDLTQYYLKTETYTKAEVEARVSAVKTAWEVVSSLPAIGEDNTIYFLTKTSTTTDSSDEYVYIDGRWELIGTTAFVLDIEQADGITINGTALQSATTEGAGLMTKDHVASLNAKADASAVVPTSRKVNGKPLTGDITLAATDVGALPSDTHIPADVTIDEELTQTSPNPVSSRGIYSAILAAGESIALSTHVADKSNPHQVTASQVGLGNVDNTSDMDKPVSTATLTALDGKVDKISGKGLSTEDFTSALKTKLGGVASGAQVNVIESVKVNGTAKTITAKAVDISVPTKVGDLEDDVGIQTASDVATAIKGKAEASDLTAHTSSKTNPHGVTKAQVGLGNVDNTSDTEKPVSTAQAAAIATKVDKISGKGLSTEDFTSALKTKLTDLYTKAQIDNLLSAIPKFSIAAVDVLPTSDISTTTVYLVPNSGSGQNACDEYVYIDGRWELLGTTAFTLSIVQADGITINGTALQSATTEGAGLMTAEQVSTLGSRASASALSAHTSDKANPHQVTKAQVGLGNVDNTSDMDKPVSTATLTALDGKVDKISGKGLSTEDFTSALKTKLGGVASGAQVNVIEGITLNGSEVSVTSKTAAITISKTTVGLGNVDNTSDLAKPISTAMQKALNEKMPMGSADVVSDVSFDAGVLFVTQADGTKKSITIPRKVGFCAIVDGPEDTRSNVDIIVKSGSESSSKTTGTDGWALLDVLPKASSYTVTAYGGALGFRYSIGSIAYSSDGYTAVIPVSAYLQPEVTIEVYNSNSNYTTNEGTNQDLKFSIRYKKPGVSQDTEYWSPKIEPGATGTKTYKDLELDTYINIQTPTVGSRLRISPRAYSARMKAGVNSTIKFTIS